MLIPHSRAAQPMRIRRAALSLFYPRSPACQVRKPPPPKKSGQAAGAERLAPLGAKARQRACDVAAPAAGLPDGVHLFPSSEPGQLFWIFRGRRAEGGFRPNLLPGNGMAAFRAMD